MATFDIPIRKLCEKLEGDLESTVRKAAMGVFQSVVLMSPVDTGRFRANWRFGDGAIDTRTSEAADKGYTTGLKAVTTTLTANFGSEWYFTNSLPYAERLEFGHSQQAPHGMVRLSVKSWTKELQKAVREQNKK